MAVHIIITRMSKILAALIGLALVSYIGYLVVAQYRTQLALQETALKQFTSDSTRRATALGYFFSERKNELRDLAQSREISAYYENEALGMSMEYGLRASLLIVEDVLERVVQSKVFGGKPVFERLLFIDGSGNVLADTAHVPPQRDQLLWKRYLRPERKGVSIETEKGDGEDKFLISVPVRFKGRFRGEVIGWISSSLIYRGFIQGTDEPSRYPTALAFQRLYLNVPAKVREMIGAGSSSVPQDMVPQVPYRIKLPRAGTAQGGGYAILVPVDGTPLSLVAFVSAADITDLNSPRHMLYTTVGIAVFILLGLFYLQVINTRNAVLQAHLEEKTLRKEAVEEKNRLLAAEIEERRQTEEALRESEAKFRALVGAVPVTIYEYRHGPAGRSFTFTSEKVGELAGISPEEMLDGDRFFNLIHPDEREATVTASDEAARTGRRFSTEFRIIKPDGEVRWILASSLPGGDSQTRYGCLEDITDRKQADLSLRESRQQLLDIISFLPDATLVVDREGRVVAWNKAMEVMTGVKAEEMIGKGNYEYAIPFYGERRPILIDLALHPDHENSSYGGLRSEDEIIYGESFTSNIGADTYLAGSASILKNSRGEVTAAIECVRDISERLRAERLLRESEATLRSLMDSMPAGVWWYDEGGRVEYLNSRFAELFGYVLEEIPTVNDWLVHAYPQADQRGALVEGRKALLKQARVNGTPVPPLETMVACRDGMLRHIIVNTQFSQGRTLEIFTDITEQEFINNELLKVQKMESLGVLAGGIAHDFNNILTGIMGYVSLAQMLLDEDHAAHPMLVSAENASQRASELAYQLLTFAKGGEPNKKVVSVPRLVEEAVSLSLRGTSVQGKLMWAPALCAVEADAGQLNQAFNNMVINAVHAMPEGGTLTVRGDNVQLEKGNPFSLEPGPYVRLLFEDEGCGIPEEVLKKIFDPYFTTKARGNGLGLASTLSIIRKHGGHVQVHSQVGTGTTFTIYLPATAASSPGGDAKMAAGTVGCGETGRTVLLMDDEEMILQLCSKILSHLGYGVGTCGDGAQAIEMYRAAKEAGTPYYAVIMDLTIPGGMGGREAAQRLLAYDPAAKLIVSSGYSHELSLSNASNYGFVGAVQKPYHVSDLAEALAALEG